MEAKTVDEVSQGTENLPRRERFRQQLSVYPLKYLWANASTQVVGRSHHEYTHAVNEKS